MSDQLSSTEIQRLRELIHALRDEQITPEEITQLEKWVCENEEARWIYVQYMNLSGVLAWQGEDGAGYKNPNSKKQQTGKKTVVLGSLGDLFQIGTDILSKPITLTLMLTIGLPGMLLLVLMLSIARQPIPRMPVTPARPMVATITRDNGCIWEATTGQPQQGTRLYSGQKLQLRKGLAGLTFDDGAYVILQGPAEFEVAGSNKAMLKDGKFVAKVPKRAVGFTIATPEATIVDLGTEFGLLVANGTSEVHVFKGEVKVRPKPDKKGTLKPFEKLTVGQAAKIDLVETGQIQVHKITSAPKQFIRRLPPQSTDGLPEPTILFAHRGSRDPETEGWEFVRTKPNGQRYQFTEANGLSKELRDEARAKGWVLRARFKLVGQESVVSVSEAFCGYWEENRQWRLRPCLASDHQQSMILYGDSTLGKNAMAAIPDSRDRFVDYEVRYYPMTDDADVYVDNRYVATMQGTRFPNVKVLQFGTANKEVADLQCEIMEWGIIRKH